MKFEELKKIVIDAGCDIKSNSFATTVVLDSIDDEELNEIRISELDIANIVIDCFIEKPKKFAIIDACMDYAKTPLEERQKEKKYYLKHRFMCGFEKCAFFNIDSLNKALYLSDKTQTQYVQTQFTRAEIEEIKEKYDTDLKDFEKIEVEE